MKDQLEAKDQLVRELTAYVKQQAASIDDLIERGDQAHEETCRLREEVLKYQQRESKGKRFLMNANSSFHETHGALRGLADDLRRSRPGGGGDFHQAIIPRLDEIVQGLEQRFHAARAALRDESDGAEAQQPNMRSASEGASGAPKSQFF